MNRKNAFLILCIFLFLAGLIPGAPSATSKAGIFQLDQVNRVTLSDEPVKDCIDSWNYQSYKKSPSQKDGFGLDPSAYLALLSAFANPHLPQQSLTNRFVLSSNNQGFLVELSPRAP